MLDQNTDRMWYVIGAVIVGAAIIFLVNSSFPQLFASVGTLFEDKVEDVSKTVDKTGRTGDNLLRDSDTFGSGILFKTDGGTRVSRSSIEEPRLNSDKIGHYPDSFAQITFPRNSKSNPLANIYMKDVFLEPNTDYTFSFTGDRFAYEEIEYEIYFGEELVKVIKVNSSFVEYVITAKSPINLTTNNYIKFRSRYVSDAGSNAFWMYHPKLETGPVATPYSK